MNPLKENRPGGSDDHAAAQKSDTKPRQGDTTPQQGDAKVPTPIPRLPHEHDESADNQRTEERPSAERSEQAFRDVERGLVDTDRRFAYENQQIAGRLDQRNVERRKQPRS